MPSMISFRCSCGDADTARRTAASAWSPDAAAVRRTGSPPRCATRRACAAASCGVASLVDHVVHLAAERVQRGDGAPALRRQEEEAVVEARAARGGLLLAVFVGRHSGPDAEHAAASRTRAAPGGGGTRRSPPRSIFSRMRSPPCTIARISRPMRPGQAAAQRRAGQHQLARAFAPGRPSARARRRRSAAAPDLRSLDADARAISSCGR